MAGIEWFPAIWMGGALFGLSVFLAGHLTPSYSHLYQSISELGVRDAPYSLLVRFVGFVPLGLSFMIYAHQTMELFVNSVPVAILLLIGFATSIAGLFPTDPQNRRDTVSGKIHAAAVGTLLALLTVAPFLFSYSDPFRIPFPDWFINFSLSTGFLALAFFGLLSRGKYQKLAALHGRIFGQVARNWFEMQGLHQRLLLSLFAVWWFAFSIVPLTV